jgi:LacI family transcriptional regulator
MKPAKVALLIETSSFYSRELLHGIRGFLRDHGSWAIYLPEPTRGKKPPLWLKKWHGQGIIARIENEEIAKAVLRTRLPVVDLSAARLVRSVPWVESDNDAIARLALDHFTERGFRNFAFFGDERFNWSKWRRNSFVRRVSEAGHDCAVFDRTASAESNWEKESAAISRWIKQLPKPAAVLACYDFSAFQLMETCRQMNVAVPDDIAVLGVNNDELLCDMADPPLSSVITNPRQTGYEAAALLQRMISGEQVAPEAHLIQPVGVATRQSTDLIAVTDPHISRAVRHIREKACEGIGVESVLKQTPLSRRVFEARFRKLLGRTPHEHLLRTKIDRVKNLLAQTDLSLERIAERAGFAYVEYMSVAFKKATGLPPSEFRKQHLPSRRAR